MYIFLVIIVLSTSYIFLLPAYKDYKRKKLYSSITGMRQDYLALLKKYQPYYSGLLENEKRRFERRTQYFILTTDFYTFNDLEISSEMIVLTSAAAVQLTFGLERFWLDNVKAILIYPTSFKSYRNMPRFRGEFKTNGQVSLSWEHFISGYIESNDGINLGLHEMAHALNELEEEGALNQKFEESFRQWEKIAGAELWKIRKGENDFIREYGATNMYEMFAVCTEYFFEVPEEFKNAVPGLFDTMMDLYNQNPINKSNPVIVEID